MRFFPLHFDSFISMILLLNYVIRARKSCQYQITVPPRYSMSVCFFVCTRLYLRNYISDLQTFCPCYVTYSRGMALKWPITC